LKTLLRDSLIRAIAPVADALYRERPRVRVVVFHDTPVELAALLRERLLWLGEHASIVSLEEAAARSRLDPERLNVALTFDDGLKEHHGVAAQLLDDLGLTGTFFIPTGALDLEGAAAAEFSRTNLRRQRRFEFMSSGELRELAEHLSFEIGGHTESHPDLSVAVDLDAEVSRSKETLERLTGRSVRWFAYPFGSPEHVSVTALQALERAGYRGAFTIVPSFWSVRDDPFLIGRDALTATDTEDSWERFLRGGYDALSELKYRKSLAKLRRSRLPVS
jgi:peptidoglycan/xylan/chitin deacetylase (PgdA/CDA1 family)